MRINKSLLGNFTHCDLKGHWLRSMPKAKASARTSTPGNVYGRTQHKVMEDVYSWVKAQAYVGPLHAPHVIDFARRSVNERCFEAEVPEDQKVDMWGAILDYMMEQHYVVGSDIIGIEMFLRAKTPAGNELTGFADRIDRTQAGPPGVSIIDYKGSNWRPDPEQLQHDTQVQIYLACALSMFPWAERFEFRMEMLSARYTARARWNRIEVSYMSRSVMQLADEQAKEISTFPWLPNSGPHCERCPFKGKECPATGGDVPDGWYDPRLSWDEQAATN